MPPHNRRQQRSTVQLYSMYWAALTHEHVRNASLGYLPMTWKALNRSKRLWMMIYRLMIRDHYSRAYFGMMLSERSQAAGFRYKYVGYRCTTGYQISDRFFSTRSLCCSDVFHSTSGLSFLSLISSVFFTQSPCLLADVDVGPC